MSKRLNPFEKELLIKNSKVLRLTIKNELLKKLCYPNDTRWKDPDTTFKSEEFRVIEQLSKHYPVKDLCAILGVSRSRNYKHLKLKAAHQLRCSKFYDALYYVSLVHEAHPSHGYRWVTAFIESSIFNVIGVKRTSSRLLIC